MLLSPPFLFKIQIVPFVLVPNFKVKQRTGACRDGREEVVDQTFLKDEHSKVH